MGPKYKFLVGTEPLRVGQRLKRLFFSMAKKVKNYSTMLRVDSFHPPWLIENIPFGQFQRLKRICDSEADFKRHAQDTV